MKYFTFRRLLLQSLFTAACVDLSAQVLFQNISTPAGLDYQGRSYGSSWGDINGDGLMDIFMSCHENKVAELYLPGDTIRIFLNMGNGQFDEDIYIPDNGEQSDFHGGVFFDRDNDGDQDMLLLTGGTKKNVLLRNDGATQLLDHATELNIDLGKSRGRQSTLMDINHDGFLDVLVNNDVPNNPLGHGSVWMKYDADLGYVMAPEAGQMGPNSWFSSIADLNNDQKSDLIVVNYDSLRIYSLGQNGEFTLQNRIDYANIADISIADFNGDLRPDIFLARSLPHATDIQQFNDSAIHISYNMLDADPPGVLDFRADGPVEVAISTLSALQYQVNIGSGQNQPVSQAIVPFTFTLDKNDPGTHGFPDVANLPAGVNCSFGLLLPDSIWHIELNVTGSNEQTFILSLLTPGSTITDFSSTGTPEPGEESRNKLLINQGDYTFVESTDPAFMLDEFTMNVTSGDFDNDMDIDLVVVETGRAKNRPSHLYENIGNGQFVVHTNGWGIQGDVAGIGDAVTTGDFDNDGFLDLFITNGSTSFFLDSAGVDLYRNLGNANHWLTLDLEGTESNRDGIGAQVFVLAGGVTQVANRSGGIHASSQDDPRIHFGLGANLVAAQVIVRWPSGTVDGLTNVVADQFVTIVEGEHPLPTGFPEPPPSGFIPDPSQVDHVVVIDALGKRVARSSYFDPVRAAESLRLGPGSYVLKYMGKRGELLGTRKYLQP